MPSPKRTPERKSRSGSHVPNSLRGTVRVEVRCSPELAARARALTTPTRTLADLLEAGVEAESLRAGIESLIGDYEMTMHTRGVAKDLRELLGSVPQSSEDT